MKLNENIKLNSLIETAMKVANAVNKNDLMEAVENFNEYNSNYNLVQVLNELAYIIENDF